MNRLMPKYLEWIRKQPCAMCGYNYSKSQAHHLKGEFHMSGTGMKAPDFLAMPLCASCHANIHAAKHNWKRSQRDALLHTLMIAFWQGALEVTEGS